MKDETDKEDEPKSYEDGLADAVSRAYDDAAAKAGSEAEKAPEPAPREPEPKAEAEKPAERDDNRDERGRFKARDEKPAEKPADAPDKADQATPAEKAPDAQPQGDKPPTAPVASGPPSSWGIPAKAAWDSLPAHVRAEIDKREKEIAQGFGALRETKELKQYADMAAQQGATLPQMLQHYTKTVAPLERMLRQDLGSGLAVIAQNAGLNQQQAAQLFAQLAAKYGGGQPVPSSNGAAAPAANGAARDAQGNELASVFQPFLSPLEQRLQNIEEQSQADRNARAEADKQTIRKAWDAFAGDPANRYANDVKADIVWLIDNGKVPSTGNWAADLKAAYDMACRLHPEIHEAQIEMRLAADREAQRKREQEAADKARAASRSVTGNRMPGVTVKAAERQSRGSYEDKLHAAVEAAYNAHTA